MNTRKIYSTQGTTEKPGMSAREKEEALQKARDYYSSRSSNPNSLSAKANMVKDYNERSKKN